MILTGSTRSRTHARGLAVEHTLLEQEAMPHDTSRLLSLLLLVSAGCATSPGDGEGEPDTDPGQGDPAGVVAEVFANSESALYRLDPTTKALTRVGAFDCIALTPDPADSLDGMTDIAVDASGALYGVGNASNGSWGLFSIDRQTAHCTSIPLSTNAIGGLTFVPAGTVDPDREALVGLDQAGKLHRIDLATGSAVELGSPDTTWGSKSADLVSIRGDRTYSTNSQGAGDHLVVIDPTTSHVMADIGTTGLTDDAFGGIGYWGGTIYGFTWDGRLYAIDATSAAISEIAIPNREPGLRFVGAAVTTAAPIVLL